jgi:glutaredoxin
MRWMAEKILFSLENCVKCIQTKEILGNRNDITMVTLPHNLQEWSEDQKQMVRSYDVLDDLQRTAPVLWTGTGKYVGYLRIRKWLQDHL